MVNQDDYTYEIVDIDDVYQDGNFEEEYVYDLSMNNTTEQTFFANDILVHNSIYISFKEVMDKLGVPNDFETRKKTTKVLTNLMIKKIDKYNEEKSMSKYNSPNMIFWDSELLADTAIFCKKKKYTAHMIEQDGFPCDKLLIKGLDIIRSSTPRVFRDSMKEAVEMMLKYSTEKDIDEFSYNLYKDFCKWDIDSIALPKACNNMEKWVVEELEFKSGCPQHMKGAVTHNILVDKYNLVDVPKIRNDDKFKLLLLKKGNPLRLDCIAYMDKLPPEFAVDESYIDKPRMFELGYTSPMKMIYESIKWHIKDYHIMKEDIDDLFD